MYVGKPAGSGIGAHVITANAPRVDIGNGFGVGNYHGFSATFSTTAKGSTPVYIYAINKGAGTNVLLEGARTANVQSESEPPKITDVRVENLTPDGYRVACTVTDNIGVDRVLFPTWTAPGGQDDITWAVGTKSGNTYYHDVKVSDHKNGRGCHYNTHIYAYDLAGNASSSGLSSNVMVPNAMANLGDSTYFLVEASGITWANAKSACENSYGGGHLVTIESAQEQATVAALARQGSLDNYWIGASDTEDEGVWKWVTGATLDRYSNWGANESRGGTNENVAAIHKADGTWRDYGEGAHTDIGYIMEVQGLHARHGKVVTDLEEGIYSINCFAATDYAVDVFNMDTAPGANVGITVDNGTDAQRFKVSKNDDDTYTITNVHSNCALDVAGGSLETGANVQQYTPNGSAAQRWYLERSTDGGYHFRSKVSNYYLHVVAGSYARGTNLIVWQAVDNPAQKFTLRRAEHPTSIKTEVYDVTPDGYKVRAELFAPSGIKSVSFPTWTAAGGQDDIIWREGSVTGNVAKFEVRRSDHKGEYGLYSTHIWVTDSYGHAYCPLGMDRIVVPNAIASWGGSTYYLVDNGSTWADAQEVGSRQGSWLPGKAHLVTIGSAEEQAVVAALAKKGGPSFTSCWIGASDAEAEGAWRWVTGEDLSAYGNWGAGEPGGGTKENVAGLSKADGAWHDYAEGLHYDFGYVLEVDGDDRVGPEVTEVEVSALDETGYTVDCILRDPSDIKAVTFTTYATANGKASARQAEGELFSMEEGDVTVAELRVDVADHRNATGSYVTSISAVDALGNETVIDVAEAVGSLAVPDATRAVGDAVYYRFDQVGTWQQASAAIKVGAAKGMALASVTSEEEGDAIASLLAGAPRAAYWVGLVDERGSGSYSWSDGSALSYTHWASGQPVKAASARYRAVLASNLMWYGYPNAGMSDASANMGFIAKLVLEPTDVGDVAPCAGEHTWGGMAGGRRVDLPARRVA